MEKRKQQEKWEREREKKKGNTEIKEERVCSTARRRRDRCGNVRPRYAQELPREDRKETEGIKREVYTYNPDTHSRRAGSCMDRDPRRTERRITVP